MSQTTDEWKDELLNIFDDNSLNDRNRIVSTTFSNIYKSIVKKITGDENSNWPDFYKNATEMLPALYGLTVKTIRGGALELVSLDVPSKIGQDIAKSLLREGNDGSDEDARNLLKEAINPLDQRMLDLLNIDIDHPKGWLKSFRSGFSSVSHKNSKYTFKTGGRSLSGELTKRFHSTDRKPSSKKSSRMKSQTNSAIYSRGYGILKPNACKTKVVHLPGS